MPYEYEPVLETKTHLTRSLAQQNGLSTMSQLLASTDVPNRSALDLREARGITVKTVGGRTFRVGDRVQTWRKGGSGKRTGTVMGFTIDDNLIVADDGKGNGERYSAPFFRSERLAEGGGETRKDDGTGGTAAASSESGGEVIDLLDSSSDEENSAANHNDGNDEIIELLDSSSDDDGDDEVASMGQRMEATRTTDTTAAAATVKPKKKKRRRKKKKARFGKGVVKTRGISVGDRVKVSSEGPKNLRDKEAVCRGFGGTQSNPVVLLLLDDDKKSAAPLTTCSVVSIGSGVTGGSMVAPRQPAPHGHGRGRSAPLPAWMATGGSANRLGSTDAAGNAAGGGASTAAAATSSALAVPPKLASHAGMGGAAGAAMMTTMPSGLGVAAPDNGSGGGGRGRGRAQTLPAWMTNSGGSRPSSSLPTSTADVGDSVQAEPAPAAPDASASASAVTSHLSQPNSVVGAFNSAVVPARGRGRAKILPAWMTTGAAATNATATATNAPTSAAATTKTASSGGPQLHVGQYFSMNALAVDGSGDQYSARNDDEIFFIDRNGEE